MEQVAQIIFPPFRLDIANEQLWKEDSLLALRPKSLAVLRYLTQHSGRLVTKDELLQAVWPNTTVSEWVLTTCLREIRQALGDSAHHPQYVETVHRRGYRFIAQVSSEPSGVSPQPKERTSSSTLPIHHPQPSNMVGREAELAQLQSYFAQALGGQRQVVFVTGEPGIGKTTVVEEFLAQVAGDDRVWIGRGQCIDHYGAGEAYLPILEALGQLSKRPEREQLRDLLSQHAPTWLVQLPGLVSAAELELLQRKVFGSTQERMLRELAEALEVLTAEQVLILRLEDLHWSDYSTLDLLAYLARRTQLARLLVLSSYRPADVIMREHPLRGIKQELQLHGQCQELALELLSEEAIAEYLAHRLPGVFQQADALQSLAQFLHQRTEGNPLFMINVVNDLVRQRLVVEQEGQWELSREVLEREIGAPENIRELIERQLERLSAEEQALLEAASVAGAEFSPAVVAAGVDTGAEETETICDAFVRRQQFIQARGTEEWPDGTITTRYGFVHALYQEVLLELIPLGRRVRLHRQIGERKETGYREQTTEIAAELAVHFEQGRENGKAVQYREQAARQALQRSANREAIDHLSKGLELLKTLPDTPERTQQELSLQIALGSALVAIRGFSVPEVEKAYTRAQELCQQVGETPQLFSVLYGLWMFYLSRAELQVAHELAEQLLNLAQRQQDPTFLVMARYTLGMTSFMGGELIVAREHLEQGIALYDPQQHWSLTSLSPGGYDPGVGCLSFGASTLWHLGYPDQAVKKSQEALSLSRELAHPFVLASALVFVAIVHQLCQEGHATQEQAEAAIALSTDQGFSFWFLWGTMLQGWALAEQGQGKEVTVQMSRDMDAWRATGEEAMRLYFLVLQAEAHEKAGQVEEGLSILAEGLRVLENTGERFCMAELYRLKGELLLAQEGKKQKAKSKSKKESEAEKCFQQAIDTARRQSAKSLELRATMSLSRLWQKQGKKKEARRMLAEVYGWFTEGFDTKDLQEAKALLNALV